MKSKFKVWDKEWACWDDDLWLHSDGRLYDRAAKTYDTPNLELELVDQERYTIMVIEMEG